MRGRTIFILLVALALCRCGVAAEADGIENGVHGYTPEGYVVPQAPEVRDRLEWFRDQKLALMMHFGLYSVPGIVESWPLSDADASWARKCVDWTADGDTFKRQYYGLNKSFNPIRFEPEKWAKIAKDCGFKYIIFTTKHHDGFCLYDSKYSDFKVTAPECPFSSNPRADIVKHVFDAFRAQGLGIGAYFSKPDWHHNDYWENYGIGHRTSRHPTYDVKKQPEKWARFKEYAHRQILEVVRNYRPDIIWLDGGQVKRGTELDIGIEKIIEEARAIDPRLISVDRCGGGSCENVITPEQFVPETPVAVPWESCITLGSNWGYFFDDKYKSSREIIHLLISIVAKGGNLALNVGPQPDGRLPGPAIERMRELGAWLKANGDGIYGTRSVPPFAAGDWRFTRKRANIYAIRLWKEGESGIQARTLSIPGVKAGEVASVRHLASGKELPFKPGAGGELELALPEKFVFDRYADAFALALKTERFDSALKRRLVKKFKTVREDTWYGYPRYSFNFNGCSAWIVEPRIASAKDNPWTWTMQWADAFVRRQGVLEMLARGWHHVTIDTFYHRMDENGLRVSRDFQRFLVEELGFSPKANLIGMSWGGFFSIRYANAFPDCVRRIYLDAPLLNFAGFPSACGKGGNLCDIIGSWGKSAPAEARLWTEDGRMPVNMASSVAKAKIPILLLYGAKDDVVLPKLNCELFARRFKEAGGELSIERRDTFKHHPHGLEGDELLRIVDFFSR